MRSRGLLVLLALLTLASQAAAPGPPAAPAKVGFATGWVQDCWVRSDLLPRPDVPLTSLCRLSLFGGAGTDAARCDDAGCEVTVDFEASALGDTPTLQVAGLLDGAMLCQAAASLPGGPGAPPTASCPAGADIQVAVAPRACTTVEPAARATVAPLGLPGGVGLLAVRLELCRSANGAPSLAVLA